MEVLISHVNVASETDLPAEVTQGWLMVSYYCHIHALEDVISELLLTLNFGLIYFLVMQ